MQICEKSDLPKSLPTSDVHTFSQKYLEGSTGWFFTGPIQESVEDGKILTKISEKGPIQQQDIKF